MDEKDLYNKKHLTVKNNNFSNDRNDKIAGLDLILENGDEIIDLTKKAQQQIAELDKTLDDIQKFIPQFRLK